MVKCVGERLVPANVQKQKVRYRNGACRGVVMNTTLLVVMVFVLLVAIMLLALRFL
jgi:hypothetical protein